MKMVFQHMKNIRKGDEVTSQAIFGNTFSSRKGEISNVTVIIILVIILSLLGFVFMMKQASNFKSILGM